MANGNDPNNPEINKERDYSVSIPQGQFDEGLKLYSEDTPPPGQEAVKVDYFALRLSGTGRRDAEEYYGGPVEVVFNMNTEEVYKNYVQTTGRKVPYKDFMQQHNSLLEDYIKDKESGYNRPRHDMYGQMFRDPFMEMQYGRNYYRSTDINFLNTPGDPEFSLLGGGRTRVRTAEEVAEKLGYFYDTNATPLDGNGNPEIDENGREYTGAWVPLSKVKTINSLGVKTYFDEKGDEQALVLGRSKETGDPFWYTEGIDKSLKESTLRSVHGPKRMQETLWQALYSSFYNEAFPSMVYGTPGAVQEMVGAWYDPTSVQGQNLLAAGNRLQNIAGMSKSKASHAREMSGVFDGFHGGSYLGLMGGIGSLGGQLAPLVLMSTTLGLARMPAILVQGNTMGAASLYAGYAFNNQAKEMGISLEDRKWMYPKIVAATMLSEAAVGKVLGSGVIDSGLFTPASQKRLWELQQKQIFEALEGVEGQAVQKKWMQRYAGGVKKWYQDVADGKYSGFGGRVRRGIAEGSKESVEELVQGYMENATQMWHDYIHTGEPDRKVGEGLFGMYDDHRSIAGNIYNYMGKGSMENLFLGFLGGMPFGMVSSNPNREFKNAVLSKQALEKTREEHVKWAHDRNHEKPFDYPFLKQDGKYVDENMAKGNPEIKTRGDLAFETLLQQINLAHDIIEKYNLKDPTVVAKMMGGDIELVREGLQSMINVDSIEKEIGGLADDDASKAGLLKQQEAHQKKFQEVISGQLHGEYLARGLSNKSYLRSQYPAGNTPAGISEALTNDPKWVQKGEEIRTGLINFFKNIRGDVQKLEESRKELIDYSEGRNELKDFIDENSIDEIEKDKSSGRFKMGETDRIRSAMESLEKKIEGTDAVEDASGDVIQDGVDMSEASAKKVTATNELLKETAFMEMVDIFLDSETKKAAKTPDPTKARKGADLLYKMVTSRDFMPEHEYEASVDAEMIAAGIPETFTEVIEMLSGVNDRSKELGEVYTKALERPADLARYYKKGKKGHTPTRTEIARAYDDVTYENEKLKEVLKDYDGTEKELAGKFIDNMAGSVSDREKKAEEYNKATDPAEKQRILEDMIIPKPWDRIFNQAALQAARDLAANPYDVQFMDLLRKRLMTSDITGESFMKMAMGIQDKHLSDTPTSEGDMALVAKVIEELKVKIASVGAIDEILIADDHGQLSEPLKKAFGVEDDVHKDVKRHELFGIRNELKEIMNSFIGFKAILSGEKHSVENNLAHYEQEGNKIKTHILNQVASALGITLKKGGTINDPLSSADLLNAEQEIHEALAGEKEPWRILDNPKVEEMFSLGGDTEVNERYESGARWNLSLLDFTFDNFMKTGDSDKSFRIHYLTTYLGSLMRLSPKTFYAHMKDAVDYLHPGKGGITIEQMDSVRHIVSAINGMRSKGDKTNLFMHRMYQKGKAYFSDEVVMPGHPKVTSDGTIKYTNNNVISVFGNASAGKTQMLYPTALLIDILMNRSRGADKIAIVADNTGLTGRMDTLADKVIKAAEDITKETIVVEKNVHSSKTYIDDPNHDDFTNATVWLDESSLISDEQYKGIFAKQGTGDYAILMGDMAQVPHKDTKGFMSLKLWTEFTQNLTQMFRSNVEQIWYMQRYVREKLFNSDTKDAKMPLPETKYYIDDTDRKGVKYYLSPEELFEDAKKRIEGGITDIAIIVTGDKERTDVVAKYALPPDKVYTMEGKANPIQGDERTEVYVYIPESEFVSTTDEDYQRHKSLFLTAVSRPKRFLGTVGDPKASTKVATKDGVREHAKDDKAMEDARLAVSEMLEKMLGDYEESVEEGMLKEDDEEVIPEAGEEEVIPEEEEEEVAEEEEEEEEEEVVVPPTVPETPPVAEKKEVLKAKEEFKESKEIKTGSTPEDAETDIGESDFKGSSDMTDKHVPGKDTGFNDSWFFHVSAAMNPTQKVPYTFTKGQRIKLTPKKKGATDRIINVYGFQNLDGENPMIRISRNKSMPVSEVLASMHPDEYTIGEKHEFVPFNELVSNGNISTNFGVVTAATPDNLPKTAKGLEQRKKDRKAILRKMIEMSTSPPLKPPALRMMFQHIFIPLEKGSTVYQKTINKMITVEMDDGTISHIVKTVFKKRETVESFKAKGYHILGFVNQKWQELEAATEKEVKAATDHDIFERLLGSLYAAAEKYAIGKGDVVRLPIDMTFNPDGVEHAGLPPTNWNPPKAQDEYNSLADFQKMAKKEGYSMKGPYQVYRNGQPVAVFKVSHWSDLSGSELSVVNPESSKHALVQVVSDLLKTHKTEAIKELKSMLDTVSGILDSDDHSSIIDAMAKIYSFIDYNMNQISADYHKGHKYAKELVKSGLIRTIGKDTKEGKKMIAEKGDYKHKGPLMKIDDRNYKVVSDRFGNSVEFGSQTVGVKPSQIKRRASAYKILSLILDKLETGNTRNLNVRFSYEKKGASTLIMGKRKFFRVGFKEFNSPRIFQTVNMHDLLGFVGGSNAIKKKEARIAKAERVRVMKQESLQRAAEATSAMGLEKLSDNIFWKDDKTDSWVVFDNKDKEWRSVIVGETGYQIVGDKPDFTTKKQVSSSNTLVEPLKSDKSGSPKKNKPLGPGGKFHYRDFRQDEKRQATMEEKLLYDATVEQIKDLISRMLGKEYLRQFKPFFEEGLRSPENYRRILGLLDAARIGLDTKNGSASTKAAVHEIMHYVLDYILDPADTTKVLAEIKDKYGDQNMDVMDTMHYIALEFEVYNADKDKWLKSWGRFKFLGEFFDWLSHIVRKSLGMETLAEGIMYNTYYGKYTGHEVGKRSGYSRSRFHYKDGMANMAPAREAFGNNHLAFNHAVRMLSKMLYNSSNLYSSAMKVRDAGNIQDTVINMLENIKHFGATELFYRDVIRYPEDDFIRTTVSKPDMSEDQILAEIEKHKERQYVYYEVDQTEYYMPYASIPTEHVAYLLGEITVSIKVPDNDGNSYYVDVKQKDMLYADGLMPRQKRMEIDRRMRLMTRGRGGQMDLYSYYVILDRPEVYRGLLQRPVSNLPMGKVFDEKNMDANMLYLLESTYNDSVNGRANDEIDISDTISDILKNIIHYTPLQETTVDYTFQDSDTRTLDVERAFEILRTVGMASVLERIDKDIDEVNDTVNDAPVQRFMQRFRELIEERNPYGTKTRQAIAMNERWVASEEYMTIQTIWNKFFNPEAESYAAILRFRGRDGYTEYLKWRENAIEKGYQVEQDKLSEDDFNNTIAKKLILAEGIVASVINEFRSIKKTRLAKASVRFKTVRYNKNLDPTGEDSDSGEIRIPIYRFMSVKNTRDGEIERDLKNDLGSFFMRKRSQTDGEVSSAAVDIFKNGIHYDDIYKEKEKQTKEASLKATPKQLTYKGKVVTKFNSKGKRSTVFSHVSLPPSFSRVDFIRESMRHFGIKMSQADALQLTKDSGEITFTDFLDTLALFTLTAKTLVGADVRGEYANLLYKFNDSDSYGKITEREAMNITNAVDSENDFGDPDRDLYFFTGFFEQMGILTTAMANARGSYFNNHSYGVMSERIYTNQISSAINDYLSLSRNVNEKDNMSNAFKAHFALLNATGQMEFNGNVDLAGNFVNPLMDEREAGVRILDIHNRNGIKLERSGVKSKNFTEKDYLSYHMGMFESKARGANPVNVVPLSNNGVRSSQDIIDSLLVTAESGENSTGVMIVDNSKTGYDRNRMDWPGVYSLMEKTFELHRNKQRRSIQRLMISADEIRKMRGQNPIFFDIDIEDVIRDDDWKEELKNSLPRNIEELMASNLYTNKDYLVTKDEETGNFYMELGLEATLGATKGEQFKDGEYAGHDVYNIHKLMQLQELQSDARKSARYRQINKMKTQYINDYGEVDKVRPALDKWIKRYEKNQKETPSDEMIEKEKQRLLKKAIPKEAISKMWNQILSEPAQLSPSDKKNIIWDMYGDRLHEFSRKAATIGHQIPVNLRENQDDKYIVKGFKFPKIHPLYGGMYFAQHFTNEFILEGLAGGYAEFAGVKDLNKRLQVFSSPGKLGDTSRYLGVDKETFDITIRDPQIAARIFSHFGEEGAHADMLEEFDGLAIDNPIFRFQQHVSWGRNFGMVALKSMVKDVSFQVDSKTGKLDIIKRATDTITPGTMEWSKMDEALLMYMLNPTMKDDGSLYHELMRLWRDENTPWDDAIVKVAHMYAEDRLNSQETGEPRKYHMVSRVSFSSGKKSFSENKIIPFNKMFVNDELDINFMKGLIAANPEVFSHPSGGFNYEAIGNRINEAKVRIQLNPYDTSEEGRKTMFAQLMSIVTSTDADAANGKALREVLGQIVDRSVEMGMAGLQEARKEYDAGNIKEARAMYSKMVKNMIRSEILKANEATNILTLLENPFTSVHFPQVEKKAIQYIASYLTKNGIKAKMEAQRLNESNRRVQVYEYEGRVYSRKGLTAHLTALKRGGEITAALQAGERGLKQYKVILDVEAAQEKGFEFSMDRDEYGNDVPALNFINKQKFFIEENDSDIVKAEKTKYRDGLIAEYKRAKKAKVLKMESGEVILPARYVKRYGVPTDLPLPMLFTLYKNRGGVVEPTNLMDLLQNEVQKTKETDAVRRKQLLDIFYKEVYNTFETDILLVPGHLDVGKVRNLIMAGTSPFASNISGGNTFLDGIIKEANGVMEKIYMTVDSRPAIEEELKRTRALYATKFAAALAGVYQQLEVLSVRTPSTNASSAWIASVAGFHDNGNTMYSNYLRALLDSHDHDIDQSSVYFFSDTDDRVFTKEALAKLESVFGIADNLNAYRKILFGHEYQGDQKLSSLTNQIVEHSFEYYKNIDNAYFTMDPIDLQPLRDLAGRAKGLFPGQEKFNDFTTNMIYHVISMDGEAVGPFALATKGYTFLTTSMKGNDFVFPKKKGAESFFGPEWISDPQYIAKTISRLGAFTNAATDNPKEQILGRANISIRNADMVSAMIVHGSKIVDYVNFRRQQRGEPVRNYTPEEAVFELLSTEAARVLNNKMNYYASTDVNRRKTPYQTAIGIMGVYNSNDPEKYESKVSAEARRTALRTSTIAYEKAMDAKEIGEAKEISTIWKKVSTLKTTIENMQTKHRMGKKVDLAKMEAIIETRKGLIEEAVSRGKDISKHGRDLGTLEREEAYIDPFFATDMFMLAQYAMAGDWLKRFTRIADINQGLKANKWEMYNYIHNLEVMTGMKFDEVISHINGFKASKMTAEEYMKSQKLVGKGPNGRDSRIAASKEMLKNTFDNKDWMDSNLGNGYDQGDSKYRFLNYKEQIFESGDSMAAILSLPDLMGNLRALQVQKEVMERSFITGNTVLDRFITGFAKKIGLDHLYKNQYNKLIDEIYKWLIDRFLNDSTWWEKDMLNGKGGTQTFMDFDGDSVQHRVQNPADRFRYAYEFPEYFYNEISELKKKPGYVRNELYENIVLSERNDMPTVEIVNPYRVDDHILDDLRAGFDLMPPYLKKQLALYQIITGGFSYGKGSFEKVLDIDMYQAFSDWILKFESKLSSPKTMKSIVRLMNTKFEMTLLSNPNKEMAQRGRYDEDVPGTDNSHVKYEYFRPSPEAKPWMTPFRVYRKLVERTINGVKKKVAKFYINRMSQWSNEYSDKKSTYVETKLEPGKRSHREGGMDRDRYIKHLKYLKVMQVTGNPSEEISFEAKKWKNMYSPGDKLYFQDGTVGKVVRKSNEFVYYQLTMDSEFPVFENSSHSDVKFAVKNLNYQGAKAGTLYSVRHWANQMNKLFPNIKKKFISNTEAVRMGEYDSLSFIKKGIIFFNMDRVTPNTAFHEFGHVWGIAMRENKVTKPFYDFLVRQLMQPSTIKGQMSMGDFVTNKYGNELDRRGLELEAVATYLGMRREDRQSMLPDSGEINNQIYEWMLDTFGDLFGKTPNLDLRIEDIVRDADKYKNLSVREIADAVLNTFEDKKSLEIDAMTSAQLAGYANYTMKQKAPTSGLTLADLMEFLRPSNYRGEAMDEKRRILRYVNDNIGGTRIYYTNRYTGQVYTLGDGNEKEGTFKPWTGKKLSDFIWNTIVRDEYKARANFEKNMVKFLQGSSNRTDLVSSAAKTIRPGMEQYLENPNSIEFITANDELNVMLNYLDFNPQTDVTMRLSDGALQKNYGISVPPALTGYNPIVIVHNAKGEGSISLSIVRMTGKNMDDNGINRQGILRKYLNSDRQAKRNGITMDNSIANVNLVIGGIQAMAIKKANPDMKFRNIGTMALRGYRVEQSNPSFETRLEHIDTLIPQLQNIFAITEFTNALHPDIQNVVNDKKLYDPNIFGQPYLLKLEEVTKNMYKEHKGSPYASGLYQLDKAIKDYNTKDDANNYATLVAAIQKRINKLKFEYNKSTEELATLPEYVALLEAMVAMDDNYREFRRGVTSMDNFRKWLITSNFFDNDLANWVTRNIDIALRVVNRKVMEFSALHNTWIKELIAAHNINPNSKQKYSTRFLKMDQSNRLFEPLMKQAEGVLVKDGQIVSREKVWTFEMHWDLTDTDTQAALIKNGGHLTEAQVIYGKRVMDFLEHQFLQQIKYRYKLDRGEKVTDAKAREILSDRWKKGMMPVMPMSVQQAIAKGIKNKDDRQAIWEAEMRRLTNVDSVFEEHKSGESDDMFLSNPYLDQFGHAEMLGGVKRQDKLGLVLWEDRNDPGKKRYIRIMDKKKNDQLSRNVQDIMNYTVMASMRVMELDTRALDKVKTVNALMTAYGKLRGKYDATQNWKQMINALANRTIFGKVDKAGETEFMGMKINMDNAVMGAALYTSVGMLGFSLRVATKNGMSLGFEVLNRSLSNGFSKNGFFDFKSARTGLWELMNNRGKVMAVNDMLQVAISDDRSIMKHWYHNVTKRHVASLESAHLLLFMGDLGARLVTMVAQMVYEGSWNAYVWDPKTRKVKYDEKKDRRYYDANGKITEEGKAFKEHVKKQLIIEGWTEQEGQDKLVIGHMNDQAQKLRTLSDTYITGGTTSDMKPLLGSVLLGWAVGQFKNYMYMKGHLWFAKPDEMPKLGHLKMVNGKAQWTAPVVEGVAWTLMRTFMTFAKYREKSIGELRKMSPHQKANLYNLSLNLLLYSGIWLLWKGFAGDDDDKKDWNDRTLMYKTVFGARQEMLANITPTAMATEGFGQQIPIISMGFNLSNLMMQAMDVGDPDYFKKLEYRASRFLIFGTTYREGKNIYNDVMDMTEIEETMDLLETKTQIAP